MRKRLHIPFPMEFKIVDKNLDALFQEILKRISRLQSGGTIDSLKEIGADTDKQIGASYVSLKQLASNYNPNEALALLLWNVRRREEQIMACLLLPGNINKEKITQLTDYCLNYEIAGYLGSLFLYKYSFLAEIARDWIESDLPYRQIAMLTALARHLIIYKEDSQITKEFFTSILQREFKDKYVRLAVDRYRYNI